MEQDAFEDMNSELPESKTGQEDDPGSKRRAWVGICFCHQEDRMGMKEAIHHREGAKCRKTAATFPWEALEQTG